MSEEDIRNLFIHDYQWQRTSSSWKSLKPNKNFNHMDENDESLDNYYKRINKTYKIPKHVLEQWLYIHYYNGNTVDNYGWLNYENIIFDLVELSLSEIKSINIINAYQNFVFEGERYNAYNDFSCMPEDKEHWHSENTWRVPPIIMDVDSFSGYKIPSHADITGSLQIVEGHTRLGYLLSASRCKKPVNTNHKVYLMRNNA